MEFAYYVVRKKDMTIIEGCPDMVHAIDVAKGLNYACIIFQGCALTEMGEDIIPEEHQSEEQDIVSSEVIE